ncbi:carbohydrate ABC transporter permease [Paenibacillaceae bacterium WGS1546]|uniref:carbohydrate ABC transporter permease n=1 Tax=Cohnella sp. WGS1546 TaxID=3366810 RepID=UPI00372D358E
MMKREESSNPVSGQISAMRPISFQGREKIAAWLFILPALAGLLLFVYYPMIRSLITSFTQFHSLSGSSTFTGIDNYIQLLKDKQFLNSISNSFYFAILVIPTQTLMALGLALLVKKKSKLSGIFRTVYFIPVIVAFGVASTLFKLIYNKDYGILNGILNSFGLPSVSLLTDPANAMYGIVILCIWKTAGFFMIIFLAALNNIPANLYEAAEVDGATAVRRFIHITLPLLKRTMAFVVVITTMDAIKVAAPIFIMTNGGPADSTTTIVFYIVKTAFQLMNLGYASAAAFILFFIVMIIAIVQMRLFRSDVEY